MGVLDTLKKFFVQNAKKFFPFVSIGELYPTNNFTNFNSYLGAAQQISWVYKAVSIVGESVAMTQGAVYDQDEKEVDNPILKSIFQKPNDFMTWFEFKEALSWYLLLTGNCYILKDMFNRLGQPTKLWLLRPDRIEIIPSKNKFILGYQYDLDGTKYPFDVDEIVHIKLPNPRNDFVGMGKIEASQITYNTEIASSTYNWKFFENGASPSAILTNEGTMNDDAYERLKEMFKMRHVGFKRMQRPLLLEQGTQYKQMGLSQQDMAFIEQRKFSREEILSIFGVPPAKAGILEYASYANVKEQENTYRKDTLKPLLTRIQEKLTSEVIWLFDKNWQYEFEEVVVRDEAAYLLMATQAINSGIISPNEARELYLVLPKVDNEPMMDSHYMPFNMMEITGEGAKEEAGIAGTTTPPPEKPVEEQPIEEQPEQAHAHIHESKELNEKQQKKINLQHALLKISLATRKKLSRKIKSTAKSFFRQQAERIIGDLDGTVKQFQLLNSKGSLMTILYDEDEEQEFKESMVKATLPVTVAAFGTIEDIFNGQGKLEDSSLRRIVGQLGKRIVGINKTTLELLDKTLWQGIEAGESIDELKKRVLTVMDDREGWQAVRIARTESAFAYDKGSMLGYKDVGVKYLDVIGCTQIEEEYDCGKIGVPIDEADGLEFHPNHIGTFVPSVIGD